MLCILCLLLVQKSGIGSLSCCIYAGILKGINIMASRCFISLKFSNECLHALTLSIFSCAMKRTAKTKMPRLCETLLDLRRERDSNPRYSCPYNGFRDRPIRPLWHLSSIILCQQKSPEGQTVSAEREGFEPPDLLGQRFSRPPHSTALPSLRRKNRCSA